MRVTKADLEAEIKVLRIRNSEYFGQLEASKKQVKILTDLLRGTNVMTIALERSTEAVAHVLTDIRQIYRR